MPGYFVSPRIMYRWSTRPERKKKALRKKSCTLSQEKKKKSVQREWKSKWSYKWQKTLNFDPTTMKKFLWRSFYSVMKVFAEIVEIYFWVFFSLNQICWFTRKLLMDLSQLSCFMLIKEKGKKVSRFMTSQLEITKLYILVKKLGSLIQIQVNKGS